MKRSRRTSGRTATTPQPIAGAELANVKGGATAVEYALLVPPRPPSEALG